jgi:hypothetical protein
MSTALVAKNEELKRRREEEEFLERQEKQINPFKVATNTATIATQAGTIYNNIQESVVKQSGMLDLKMNFKLPGSSEEFSKINVFVRNPVEKKGPIKDIANTIFSSSKDRLKINPEFVQMLEEGRIADSSGNIIKNLNKSNNPELKRIVNYLDTSGDKVTDDIFMTLKNNSNKPAIGSKVSDIGDAISNQTIPSGSYASEADLLSMYSDDADIINNVIANPVNNANQTQNIQIKDLSIEKPIMPKETSNVLDVDTTPLPAPDANITELPTMGQSALNPYTAGFEKGSSIGAKAGSAASIAGSAYGAARVVGEEDGIEKFHGFVNMITPALMGMAKTAAVANPIVAPVAAVGLIAHTIWDLLD